MQREVQRILGIDAALRVTGIGVVESTGGALAAVEHGLIVNPSDRSVAECLLHLRRELRAAIDRARPSVVAMEGVFYCRNVRTAITLGAARGAALIACAEADLPVYEYSPREVKQAITGRGGAVKQQVGRMVTAMLALPRPPPEDAADALGLAICHVHRAVPRALGLARRLTGPERADGRTGS